MRLSSLQRIEGWLCFKIIGWHCVRFEFLFYSCVTFYPAFAFYIHLPLLSLPIDHTKSLGFKYTINFFQYKRTQFFALKLGKTMFPAINNILKNANTLSQTKLLHFYATLHNQSYCISTETFVEEYF